MNRHSSNKENSNLENKICGIMTSLINTQYNWSLILATLVIWSFGGAVFSYSANSHCNMDVAVNEYMKIFNLKHYADLGQKCQKPLTKSRIKNVSWTMERDYLKFV